MTTLRDLAIKHGSDKAGHHEYCGHYQKHLQHLKHKDFTLLEIGIGGYNFPDRGGAGLKMWHSFFSKAKIIGIDVYEKYQKMFDNFNRIQIFKGSQDNAEFLTQIIERVGVPEVIIDDGSHINDLTIKSFEILFPKLKPGGIYIIEDIESSWWEDVASDGTDFKGCKDPKNMSANTTINMARELINSVNLKHLPTVVGEYHEIESMHFYDNMIVIHKK